MDKIIKVINDGFKFNVELTEFAPYGEGHINGTFCAVGYNEQGEKFRFIVQKINTQIFKNPQELMENINNVSVFLKDKIVKRGGDVHRETLNVIPTVDDKLMLIDDEGGVWRVYEFVEKTICLQKVRDEKDFETVAKTFGNFQMLLSDFPAHTLHETIVDFHHTAKRFINFKKALDEDVMGRAKNVQKEIEFVLARENDCSVLTDMLEKGDLPLRVTHNDTKLNNVLIDEVSGEGICVIDLDTVMPGLSLNDFGDSIRFGSNDCDEDEKDLSKVNFSLHLFEVFTKEYLSVAGGILSDKEIENLHWGSKLMTLECGMRFLTDYLQGDVYFKIHRDGHNLDRCRTQFKLVSDMENCWGEMENIINKYKN